MGYSLTERDFEDPESCRIPFKRMTDGNISVECRSCVLRFNDGQASSVGMFSGVRRWMLWSFGASQAFLKALTFEGKRLVRLVRF